MEFEGHPNMEGTYIEPDDDQTCVTALTYGTAKGILQSVEEEARQARLMMAQNAAREQAERQGLRSSMATERFDNSGRSGGRRKGGGAVPRRRTRSFDSGYRQPDLPVGGRGNNLPHGNSDESVRSRSTGRAGLGRGAADEDRRFGGGNNPGQSRRQSVSDPRAAMQRTQSNRSSFNDGFGNKLDFNRGVATRVEDFAANDGLDD